MQKWASKSCVKIRIASFLAIFLIIAAIGCVVEKKAPVETPSEAPSVPVRMGQLSGVANMEYYAAYNNYYEEEGVNVTWVPLPSGSKIIEAVIAGEMDGGILGAVPSLVRVVSKDVPLKVVTVGVIETKEKPGDRLVALKKSGITKLEDLKGKKIAVHGFGTTLDMALRKALKQKGIDPVKDVTILQLKIQYMIPALENGDVDAVFIFPDYYPFVMNETLLLTPGDIFPDGMPISVVFFTEDFIKQHPSEIRKFVKAYLKGIEWADKNPEKIADVYVKYLGIPRDRAEKISVPQMNPSGKVSNEIFDAIVADMWEFDPASMQKNVSAKDFVDYSFLPG